MDPDVAGIPPGPATVLAVFAGGCAGGLARYAVTRSWPAGAGQLPWSTLLVNGSGALLLGLLLAVLERRGPAYLRPLLGTGLLGSWTTFGAVALAGDQLLARGDAGLALAYLLLTAAGGLALAALGTAIGRRC